MNKKNKVTESKTYVNRQLYNDPQVQNTAKKNRDDLVVVPDADYRKMTTPDSSSSYGSNANVSSTSSSSTVYEEEMIGQQPEAVIAPQDPATIKYLSNIKDQNTGEVSQPFTINAKRYQMVRGIRPDKQVVLGVYCFDDLNENGENIIHSHEDFENNIAKPMLEKENMEPAPQPSREVMGLPRMGETEAPATDNNGFLDFLNLVDVNGHRHFFVNPMTGQVMSKFKSIKEMMKSGVKLEEGCEYMDARALKQHRLKQMMNAGGNEGLEEGVDMGNLKTDVQKLTDMIMNKFRVAFEKIDTPLEQKEFISAMAKKLGIAGQNLGSLFSSVKSTVNEPTPQPVAESRKITKNDLVKSLKK